MTSDQAKEVLLRHRPGMEAEDSEIAAALALCERDPVLRVWFEQQAMVQTAIRERFRQIAPPAGLKEQIISEHRAMERTEWWQHPRILAAAALLFLLAAVAVFWLQREEQRPDELSIAAFRMRMVKEALRLYRMELESNDLEQIRSHLTRREYPADFALSPALAQEAVVTGCLTTRWQNRNVSMVCFLKDKANSAGVKSDLWLFVMDQSAVNDAPTEVKFAKVNRLITATWTKDGKLYVLGTEGDEAALRKWL